MKKLMLCLVLFVFCSALTVFAQEDQQIIQAAKNWSDPTIPCNNKKPCTYQGLLEEIRIFGHTLAMDKAYKVLGGNLRDGSGNFRESEIAKFEVPIPEIEKYLHNAIIKAYYERLASPGMAEELDKMGIKPPYYLNTGFMIGRMILGRDKTKEWVKGIIEGRR